MANNKYFDFKRSVMDPISPTYCAAKWYNATIWLNHGKTVSCHHPSAHSIDVEEIKTNPSAIHNTKTKKDLRQQMLNGERPSECKYCWDVEDLPTKQVSDRIFKTNIYSDEAIQESTLTADANVNLKTLEVSFDSTCNFACSYCSPTFSTTWQNLSKKHGAFENIQDHSVFQYQSNSGLWDTEKTKKEENPYIKAFWEWWPELTTSLQEIRITGGEPLMSDDVWKLIDTFNNLPVDNKMKLAINTNMGAKDSIITRFVDVAKGSTGRRLNLFTSAEGVGTTAEFVRYGLDWQKWVTNCERFLELEPLSAFTIMTTINALSYDSLPDFCEHMLMWKTKYPHQNIHLSLNILKYPRFLGIGVLDESFRKDVDDRLSLIAQDPRWDLAEKAGFDRLLEYSRSSNEPEYLKSDLKSFVLQYAERTGNPVTMLSTSLQQWLDGIILKKIIPIRTI